MLRRLERADLDRHRVALDLGDQVADFLRHRRREQQRLALRRQVLDDLAHVGEEAHVEHPVGLVEDEHLDVLEVRGPLAQVVEQPPRAGDDDVDPGLAGRASAG